MSPKLKKKSLAVFAAVLVVLIVVPIALFSIFVKDGGGSIYYFDSYRDLLEEFQDGSMELKDGDTVYLNDTLSGIWFNESTQYTYMTFESMDMERPVSLGYDAGYSGRVSGDYSPGDRVRLKVGIFQGLNEQRNPVLLGRIKSISHMGD